MSITLYAQPYDISASGFYFDNAETFRAKASALRNAYGDPVEEFEIQFIDGDAIDAALFEALGIHQGTASLFFEKVEEWDEHEKLRLIIAAGEGGYDFDIETGDPNDFDLDIYETSDMEALAREFVEEGLFGEIPKHLANYIDYDAIARDLAMDYTATVICGEHLIYRLS
ncbi:MAG: antirestriction protein ArdA [Parvularcula sp.]|jgi:antirestriction protein|nr:antirestriction protein ArdA [Parvularcula sp.]